MARARNIKPGFFTNDRLSECEPIARLLFIGMWTIADRRGRLLDRPRKIKAEVFPYDNLEVEPLLEQLEKSGFIVRYEVDGCKCIHINNFVKHQKPHKNENESELPEYFPNSSRSVPEVFGPKSEDFAPNSEDSDLGSKHLALNDERGKMKDERGTPEESGEAQSPPESSKKKTKRAPDGWAEFDPSVIPSELQTTEFLDTWKAFIEHRTRKGRKLSLEAQRIDLNQAAKIGPRGAVWLIEMAISRDWIGWNHPEQLEAMRKALHPQQHQPYLPMTPTDANAPIFVPKDRADRMKAAQQ